MLRIFRNEKLNLYANDYFLMFFNEMDASIELDGYEASLMDIFPKHLVIAELKKCKKIYKEISSWVLDEFLHHDFRPIHEYVLYRMLENQSEFETDDDETDNTEKNPELESLRKTLSEEEREYLDNIHNARFYMNYLFEDIDFLSYKEYYDSFGTPTFYMLGYDNRIMELLPRDKRKELKCQIKEMKQDEPDSDSV